MFKVPERYRVHQAGLFSSDPSFGNNGVFRIKRPGLRRPLHCQASDGLGWEHVSVSLPDRTPTWEEMSLVKDLFWSPEDCVLQYHPPKSDYINVHRYCLHLWRPTDEQIARPPLELIGPRAMTPRRTAA